jgi:tetratricopeptide (TPR) repeat protein
MKRVGLLSVFCFISVFLLLPSNDSYAQKKRAASHSRVISAPQLKEEGKPADESTAVNTARPPEMTAIDARLIAVDVLKKAYTFECEFTNQSVSDSDIIYNRKCYGGDVMEYHNIPFNAVSQDVIKGKLKGAGMMYYLKAPHEVNMYDFHTQAKSKVFMNEHILAWKDQADAKKFAQAAFILAEAKAGKQPFSYLERGRGAFDAANNEGAVNDALKHIEQNPKIGIIYDRTNALDIYSICDMPDCAARVTTDIAAADAAQKSSDVETAFRLYARAYAFMPDSDTRLGEIKEKLIGFYPALKAKPELTEDCRRLRVQAELAIKEMDYRTALVRFEALLKLVPWWPEGYSNGALMAAQVNKYKKAIEYMTIYLKLKPDADNARACQDKIYEWETKV